MMNVYIKSLILLVAILMTTQLLSQDTIVVQTLTFDSITTRRGTWEFPTDKSFRKILMHHTLKCDALTQHDQYPCGEWDYLTYNKVFVHTGNYDSTLYHHPSFTYINNQAADSVLISDEPLYDQFNYQHSSVSYPDTLNLEIAEVGWAEEYNYDLFQTLHYSGRSQYLWRANELSDLGFSEGYITGLKLNSLLFMEDVDHLMIRMANTSLEELTPDTLINALDTVFYNAYDFQYYDWNSFNFYAPFYWDGQSNIVVDFSFTQPEDVGYTEFWGHDPGFNCGISSASDNFAMNLDGEMDFLKLPPDVYFNSDFTFEAWFYKRNNNTWSRILDFGNGANQNNVIVVLSNSSSGKLSFHVNNDNTNKSFVLEEDIPMNEWVHVTLRLTAHLAWVYINGEYVDLGLLQQPDDTSREINYIGRSNWANDSYADMLIDELRIYNVALEPEEIKAHFRQEIEDPASDPNLVAYFNFNEGSGNIVTDHSQYGHHAECFGLPQWHQVRGSEIYLGFHQSNIRPWIQFERLESSSVNIIEEIVSEDIEISPVQLILFEDLSNPTQPTDTIEVYRAGDTYVYENGLITDTIWNDPDDILYKEDLPYYGEPFEILEEFEIGRFITPYGINLDLGPEGFTWIFDVTDYAPLLQGSVDLRAGNQQELIDLKFEMIEGTPPREVKQIDRVWGRYASYSYKNLDDDISLSATTLPLLPDAEEFKVKTRLTGHGHHSNTGNYPHCCEWKDNEHYLWVNGQQIADWHIFQYHDCGLNPVFPQGGTWPGAREGWCPGDLVNDHDFEITQYITNDEVTLDYSITPVPANNQGMGNGNYVIGMHLIQYGASNFSTDAEIYDVISPSTTDEFTRINPLCYDPQVIIRNNGTEPLTSLLFNYGVSGGFQQTFEWSGSIDPHLSDTIALPVSFSSFWLGDSTNVFQVSISHPNGEDDEYPDNNYYYTDFSLPDLWDEPFMLLLKTNNQAYRYHLQIRDVHGSVLIDWDNLENNTVYMDTIDFGDGCYTLELIDSEDMGLSYWAYPAQGTGYVKILNMDSLYVKGFLSDFGRSIFYTFNLGDISYIAEPNIQYEIDVYPNPFYDVVNLHIANYADIERITVYDIYGKLIHTTEKANPKQETIQIDLSDQKNGIYIMNVNGKNYSARKKIIKQ